MSGPTIVTDSRPDGAGRCQRIVDVRAAHVRARGRDRQLAETERHRDLARGARVLDPDPPAIVAVGMTGEQRIATGVDREVACAGVAQLRGGTGDRPALDEP